MKHLIQALFFLLLTTVATSCGSDYTSPKHEECNSVYFWKTVFQPDSAEIVFLQTHKVGRIYLRMFDVTVEDYPTSDDNLTVPNATVRFPYPLLYRDETNGLDLEFVPVVYITLDAMKTMKGKEDILAENLVTRVKNMCSYHRLPKVSSLQLDCDWTPSTEESFFTLCDSVKSVLKSLDLPWQLSSTIRLHQLDRPVPPVDCGVLMVYNTGNFDDPNADNSILDPNDVEPYLEHLSSYKLHLDVAYPAYSWQLLFRYRKFVGLLNGLNLSDTTQFQQHSYNKYDVISDFPYGDRMIFKGDLIRSEDSEIDKILRVKANIEKRLKGRPHSNIIYHLDSKNLSKYTSNEIDEIFTTSN